MKTKAIKLSIVQIIKDILGSNKSIRYFFG